MKSLAESAQRLTGQPMFQMLARVQELQKQGRQIIRFEIGDTTFGAHKHIVEATKRALDEGQTLYANSQGLISLRSAIADHVKETQGWRPSEEQIVVMPANAVIDAVIRCVVNPGEAVVMPDPGFPTYRAVTNYVGLREQFYGQIDKLADAVTEETRLLIVNSPNNPTGMVLSEEEARAVYEIADKYDVYLLSDEIYSRLVYEGRHNSPAVYDRCRERTIILNGFSKGYAMSGWRLGYAIGPVEVIKKMTLLFETMFSCLPPFIQQAGIAALTERQDVIEEYKERLRRSRDIMVDMLNEVPGVACEVPAGAIYVFADIKGTGLTAREFADRALSKAGVAVLPGSNFGPNGEGYVRLCFARDPKLIKRGGLALKREFSKIGAVV